MGGTVFVLVYHRADAHAPGARASTGAARRRAADVRRAVAPAGAARPGADAAPHAPGARRARVQGRGALGLSGGHARAAAPGQGRQAARLRLSRHGHARRARGRRECTAGAAAPHRPGKALDRRQRRPVPLRLFGAAHRPRSAPARKDRGPHRSARGPGAGARSGRFLRADDRAAQRDHGVVSLLLPARRRGVRAARERKRLLHRQRAAAVSHV